MLHGAGDIGFRRIASISDTSAALRSIASKNNINTALHDAAPRGITSNSDISAAPRGIVLRVIVLRSITPLSIAPSSADGIAPRGSGGIVFSGGIMFSGAKKRGNARRANKRLVALDERDRIAPVHGLHAQAHRVISARLVVQKHLRAQRLAQRSHVSMARDHHASIEQAIGRSHNMANKRLSAKLGHEFIAPEAHTRARCHNNASVLQCAVVASVGHSSIRLCKFNG